MAVDQHDPEVKRSKVKVMKLLNALLWFSVCGQISPRHSLWISYFGAEVVWSFIRIRQVVPKSQEWVSHVGTRANISGFGSHAWILLARRSLSE